ncbi:MAG: DEDD exonuclease domain-containing protein [Corynebacteriales bacterium]|nr:DEDD exonuclease domain-containing protein [Mycobacteriales bacterium]
MSRRYPAKKAQARHLAWLCRTAVVKSGGVSNEQAFEQVSFDELVTLTPLRDVTFMVVDLETTGTSASSDSITEIGAVKVRGGVQCGEFATLVKPSTPISARITALTGISNLMVANAPELREALPSFLEFAHGTVWVAHNAPFDIGFLKAACKQYGYPWPEPRSLDTVKLARRILRRDEVPNHKLGTLAQFFRSPVIPQHRALGDAQATVNVLHGLIDRIGNQGIQSLEELRAISQSVTSSQRRKRHLADTLPKKPGVYIFRSADNRPLYVGASRDIQARVRNYFLASETRSRMGEMVAATNHVDAIECAHALEAFVRELRIIAAHKPPYNRRDRHPERAAWLSLTNEAYPRLSLVRSSGENRLGPFRSQTAAKRATEAIHAALPLRQCTTKLSTKRTSPACVLAELGKCGAPCQHRETVDEYAAHVQLMHNAINDDPDTLINNLLIRIDALSQSQRFEDAATLRDQVGELLHALIRGQRLQSLRSVPELVAARRAHGTTWDISIIQHGHLLCAANAPNAHAVLPAVERLRATAPTGLEPAAGETELISRWLDQPGVRLVDVRGQWSCPAKGAERWTELASTLRELSRQ